MIVCPTCGHQNGDQESFCASCGAYIAAAVGDAQASAQADAPEAPTAADTPTSATPEPVVPKKPAGKPVVPRPKSSPADAERAGEPATDTPTEPVAVEPVPVVPGPVVPPTPDQPTEKIVRRLPPAPTGRARQPPSGTPTRQPGPEPATTDGAGPPSVRVAMAANEIACPSCATANDADRTFCRQCGSLLRPVVDAAPVTAGSPRSRLPVDGRVLAAGIVVLGLAGIAFAALLLRPGPEPGASASPSVIAVASPTPIAPPSQQPSELPSEPPPSEPPPSATPVDPSEPSGLLVYASRPSGGTRDIWRVELGTDPIKLTSAAGHDWDPDVSFDGSRIAWASPRGIRVSDIDGDDHFLLTHHDELDLSPAWSPDGEFIAFSSRRDGRWEIYLREAVEGASDLEPLTKNSVADHEPSWSPDGDALVYTRGSAEKAELYIVDVETKDTTRLTKNDVEDEDPAWSPDGTTIAFSRTVEGESDLYLLTVEGRQLTRLTDTENKHEHDPAWSPDGAFIAYQARGVVQIIAVATHEVVATLDLPGAAAFVSWR